MSEVVIPLSEPCLQGNELKYLQQCVETNWVSSVGAYVDRFEEMVAEYVGAKYAVATVNGTAALHIALLLAGVEPNDEVAISTLTFIAPANAIRYVGAWPVFIDAEPKYWQMDPEKLENFLGKGCTWKDGALYNKVTGRRLRAVMPVHILGHPVDMDPINELARRYDLKVIEDATESLGAKYQGRMVGTLGDIACFSFNGNKIITTGGGGMLVTDDENWARRARYLTTQAKDDSVEFVHNEIGYNYRLTNIQAAMGCAQMECLYTFIEKKRTTASEYSRYLAEVGGITLPIEAQGVFSTFWLYTVLIDEDIYGVNSRTLMRILADMNVQSRPLWQPMHLSPAHGGAWHNDCSIAEKLNSSALSLPCSVSLKLEHLCRVSDVIIENMRS